MDTDPDTVRWITLFLLCLMLVPVDSSATETSREFAVAQIPTELRNRPPYEPSTEQTADTSTRQDNRVKSRPGMRDGTGIISTPRLREIDATEQRQPDTVQPSPDSPEPDLRQRVRHPDPPADKQSFQIGVTYPGVTLGIRRPGFSMELKALHDNDITILGGRVYHHALLFDSGNLYWTADASTVQFEGERSEGEGVSFGVAGGIEKFLGPRLSWKVDVGPYYTFLEDDATGIDEDGLEFVISTGLTFHVN